MLAGIVVAGAAVRLLAARGELWLDEIWSVGLAQMLTSPIGIFTELHHDNNHHLNTLYLSWLPATPVWMAYRLHSVLAGVGTVVLAAIIARRAGDRAALTAAVLTSASFLLILYSSEARGYSLAVFFACLAVVLGDRACTAGRSTWMWAAAFGVTCAAGILSHLSFLHAYAGLVAWTVWRSAAAPRMPRWHAHLLALHLVPIACVASLYWVDLRHLVIGGGPQFTVAEVVARTLSLAAGGPIAGGLRTVTALAALGAGAASIAIVRRSGSDLWILFAATLVAPILMLATLDLSVLFERYFLVAITFTFISAGWLAAAVARRSRAAWVGLLVLFVAGNAVHTWRLVERGRGGYVPAMTRMAAESQYDPVTVGNDDEFRHGVVVSFHRTFVPGGDRIRYLPPQGWGRNGPEWMLLHSQDDQFVPEPELTVEGDRRFRLRASYPSTLLSGWHLFLYRNEAAAPR